MRIASSRRVLAAVALAVLAGIALAFAFHQAILRFAITQTLGALTQTHVTFGTMRVSTSRAEFDGVNVRSRSGEPIATIRHLTVSYDLRDLLPGGKRLYGLGEIDAVDPAVTIVHHRDGTYNIPLLRPAAGARRPAAPLIFIARVRGGSLNIFDQTRLEPQSRRLQLGGLDVDADVNTAARSRYAVALDYIENRKRYPLRGTGDIDTLEGFMSQHWSAKAIPLPRLVNYAMNSPAMTFEAGMLEHVDARYYGLPDAHGIMRNHLAASAYLNGGRISLSGLSKPIRGVHGSVDVYDGGLSARRLDASIANVPVTISGGLHDLAHPKFALTVGGRGDLAQLRSAFAAAQRRPLAGAMQFGLLVEGSARSPLVLISLRSPGIRYAADSLRNLHGLLAFDDGGIDLLDTDLRYKDARLVAQGRVAFSRRPNAITAIASLDTPASSIPYASAFVPGIQLHGSVLATADDPKLVQARGFLIGAAPAQRLTSLFDVNSAGTGTIGPLRIARAGGSLYANVALDHAPRKAGALIAARNFAVHGGALIDGDAFASMHAKQLGLIGSLRARGPWGTLGGRTTTQGTSIAFDGHYSGDLTALAHFAGNVPARGRIDAPIAMLYRNGTAIAQIRDARFSNASVHGVPLGELSATVGARGKNVRVYAASAEIANGRAIAAGNLGNSARIALSGSGVALESLRGAGLPLRSGDLDFSAMLTGSAKAPHAAGSLVLNRASYRAYPIAAQSVFSYANGGLRLDDTMLGLGPAYLAVDGGVGGLALGRPLTPAYNLHASLRGADAQALMSMIQPRLEQREAIAGSIDASVGIGGVGRTPRMSGTIDMPQGAIHGLAFRDLEASVDGTPRAFDVSKGRVAVGSTAIAFDASAQGTALQAGVRAPKTDLADFNDYFDTGDTLAGTGSLAMRVDMSNQRIATRGNAALRDLRFRRLPIGDASARWQTTGATIHLLADAGGDSGRAHLQGTIIMPSRTTSSALLSDSDLDLSSSLRGFDLATWLPLLGISAPITGHVDADASVRGRYPDVTLNANAALQGGTAGRIRIERLQFAATAKRGRGRITSAMLEIPHLSAAGSGTFGLHASDALDLTVRAASPDIGALLTGVTGKSASIGGVLDSELRMTGTPKAPLLADDFDIGAFRYGRITLPRVRGTIEASRTTASLRNGEVDLAHGKILAAANLPVHLRPFGIGPDNAPFSLELSAQDVDAADFASALPEGTHVSGRLNGRINANGALDAPRLYGALSLTRGSFDSPFEQTPIANAGAELTLSGTNLALRDVHANAGSGTISASGIAHLPNIRDLHAATFNMNATLDGAQFNLPAYFRGAVNANLSAYRQSAGPPELAGNIDVPTARLPLSALLNFNAPTTPKAPPPNVALNIHASVGNDVRVQSPNVDVGAQGAVDVSGTLRNPALKGRFRTTGGTISFFRTFTLQNAVATFDPSNGIMPYVNAQASTYLSASSTNVVIHVRGLAPSSMQVTFTSNPSYDQSQILALLAGGGASSVAGITAGGQLQTLAMGQVNQLFTRNLLEPLSASLGSALGLQNLALTGDFTSGFGISAAKAFGKNLTATFTQSVQPPVRQLWSVQAHLRESTAVGLNLYSQQQPPLLAFTPTSVNQLAFNESGRTALLPEFTGTSGFNLTYLRKFQ